MAKKSDFVLYRHYDEEGRLLYVGMSTSSLRRLESHMKGSEWSREIAVITMERFGSREELRRAEILAIAAESPIHNKHRPDPMAVRYIRMTDKGLSSPAVGGGAIVSAARGAAADLREMMGRVAHLKQGFIWRSDS